jgi:hypothetical protein
LKKSLCLASSCLSSNQTGGKAIACSWDNPSAQCSCNMSSIANNPSLAKKTLCFEC